MTNPMVILVGPSGAGKSSFVEQAKERFPELVDTVTYTTRPMREGEREGVPYHFVDEARFRSLVDKGFFVEWAEVHGNLYGTPEYQIRETWEAGRGVIMDVDVQGAKTFKAKYPQALAVFIMPPSIDELRQRVARRDGRSLEDLDVRMDNAAREIQEADQFDRQIINAEFEQACAELEKMIDEYLKSRY